MKTMESRLLAELEGQGTVEWEFKNASGRTETRPLSAVRPWTARCVVTNTGQTLIDMKVSGKEYELQGSDLISGKDLREMPQPWWPRDVEIPVHYLKALGA